jgi:hypothetical protein
VGAQDVMRCDSAYFKLQMFAAALFLGLTNRDSFRESFASLLHHTVGRLLPLIVW